MTKEELNIRLSELNELSKWLKTTQMCSEDMLLMSYYITNRVKTLTYNTN